MNTSILEDLVDRKENLTSPVMIKLSPQASEFVPTSKANPSMAVTIDNFRKKFGHDIDLENDMSNGEYEEDVLDIYFDKLAKEEDLSTRQKRRIYSKTPINATNKAKSYDNFEQYKQPRPIPQTQLRKKVKIETECGEIDRISKLPHALIVEIHSLFPITDAFRTTILSKDWQYLWTYINNIVYDNEEYCHSDSLPEHKFISLTDNVLPLLRFSAIKKFILNFVFRYDDGVSYFLVINKWLELVVNKKVEDLQLNIWYIVYPTEHDQPYSLHEVLYSSSSIIKLKYENCKILKDCVINWTSLKSLTLEDLFLQDEHIKKIISYSPLLESLRLREFCGFNHLRMTSPKCRQLELIHHGHPYGDWYSFEGDTCFFEIVAPYVEHLTIYRIFNEMRIKVRDFSSLSHVNVDVYCDEMDENIVKDLLVSARCANELIFSSWFIKVISILMFEMEDVSLPLLECRWLTISSCISKLSFPLLDNLLRSTPKLENLMIFPDRTTKRLICWKTKSTSPLKNIFKVSLHNMNNVKVIPLICHTYTSDATKLHQFLKFLLKHTVNLEKLVIVPNHNDCNSCSTNISNLMKYLLPFPTSANIS
ncbi:hypothetical protein H5410_005072 [Solanum commersonii]|uniref:F-box/LRR-repeat protein 15/At3g58940/PEG3-like LRR domain-containing protein n=1 Tax=Solanum commersonii TaxID=4109 RepID=A0A9J6A5E9_SOLCO|nr:hypothetical protein H5410_005072 [Solanum commersonii]